jgi:hypothetical protein
MAVKMAVVTNLVAVKGLQVAVNFGEGGSEGLPRSGNPDLKNPTPAKRLGSPTVYFLRVTKKKKNRVGESEQLPETRT